MNVFEKLKNVPNKKIKRLVALFLIVSLGISSAVSVSALSKNFRIKDGDTIINIRTLYSETNDVLKQAGISLGDNDKVVVSNNESNFIDVDIKRAFFVTVFWDGQSQRFIVNDGTVSSLLSQNNIIIKDHDTISHSLDEPLTPDMQISVSRFLNINISVDGNNSSVNVPEGSIGNALNFLNISLSQDDVINESLDKPVEENLNIIINRVKYEDVSEKQSIPFSVVIKKSDSLNIGDSKIETQGTNGEKELIRRVKYVDGVAVQSDIISEKTLKNPTNQVKLVGTKKANISVNENSGTINDGNGNTYSYKKVLTGQCTAYHSNSRARTSTGDIARRGLVAVNPKQIPYGTKLYIPGYGVCVAADTGGAMRAGHAMIDLYMDSEQECRNFGRRTKQIYILN